MNRRFTRRRAVAAGLAAGLLLLLASATHTYNGLNAGATVGPPGCFVAVEWRGDPGVYGSCTGTDPDAAKVTVFNDGFTDGRADAMGDDNRDGRVEEGESGWDCRTMGNGVCGADVPPECVGAGDALPLCLTVASRPAYGWTNPDGSRADNPDGRAQVADLDERPGAPGFAAALRALDAEWRAHH